MKTTLITIVMLFFIAVSYGQKKKDRKPKNETVRVYKDKDWKIKKELTFYVPKQIKTA